MTSDIIQTGAFLTFYHNGFPIAGPRITASNDVRQFMISEGLGNGKISPSSGKHQARADIITRNQSINLEAEGRFELESLAFHRRIRQAYLDMAEGRERFRVIDALGDEDAVAARVISAVRRRQRTRRSRC